MSDIITSDDRLASHVGSCPRCGLILTTPVPLMVQAALAPLWMCADGLTLAADRYGMAPDDLLSVSRKYARDIGATAKAELDRIMAAPQ